MGRERGGMGIIKTRDISGGNNQAQGRLNKWECPSWDEIGGMCLRSCVEIIPSGGIVFWFPRVRTGP